MKWRRLVIGDFISTDFMEGSERARRASRGLWGASGCVVNGIRAKRNFAELVNAFFGLPAREYVGRPCARFEGHMAYARCGAPSGCLGSTRTLLDYEYGQG